MGPQKLPSEVVKEGQRSVQGSGAGTCRSPGWHSHTPQSKSSAGRGQAPAGRRGQMDQVTSRLREHPSGRDLDPAPCTHRGIPPAQNSPHFFQEATWLHLAGCSPLWKLPQAHLCWSRGGQASASRPRLTGLHLEAIQKDHCLLASRHRWGMRPRPQSPQLLRSPEPCRACSSPTAVPGKQSWEQARGTPVLLPTHHGPPTPGHLLAELKALGRGREGKRKGPVFFFFFFFFSPQRA